MAVYIGTHRKGLLREKAETARRALGHCRLCPRKCGIDRLQNDSSGECKTGEFARVASFHPHFGEESPLVGKYGSGTLFFSHCNLHCNFCQNYEISHEGVGQTVTDAQLAGMMLQLQDAGCHNINFVSPSHVVPQILSALALAVEQGLCIPLVYNTGGYDRVKTIELLDGIIDIYMPDFKFWSPEAAELTCNAADYPEVCRKALLEMHHQVGDLSFDADGIARQGLLVRHLVMPAGLAGTRAVMRFIATQVSPDTYVNVMPQYRPCGNAFEIDALARLISNDEFLEAVRHAKEQGIHRLD